MTSLISATLALTVIARSSIVPVGDEAIRYLAPDCFARWHDGTGSQ
jgi:hypothetical protein